LPEDDNKTPYLSEVFDDHITKTIPFYYLFHQETIKFITSLPSVPNIWLDTGCGTGTLVNMALREFPKTKFFLLDPSEGMLVQARQKLSNTPDGRLEFLKASPTQNFSQELEEKPDVITAILCHHYLSRKDREKATNVCYDLLKDRGVYITFENIRPLTEEGVDIGKRYWANFQLAQGKDPKEVESHLARFDVEYFPLTVEEHLKLLRKTGFRIVEPLWYSYMQAGFYSIK
jgi:tRNA (cmo5U34)-methyltransferase